VTGTRGRNSTALATNSAVLPVSNFYRDSVSLSWQIDLWGQIRRTIESNEASAQVSAENLRGALLSAQAALVQAWVQRRVNEAQQRLLEQTQRALERSLQVTRDRYEAGVAPRTDVTQAETQLLNARAQAIELGVAHAQLSHAIAVLTGRPPGALSISASTTVPQLPPIPRMLPSQLLERRPDIVGAERQVASANALVGVAETAFYPTLSLSSALGITSDLVSRLASVPYHYWSVGPTVAAPIFDNGLRKAQLAQAQAAWEQTVAQYRQTVLVAFQEVEDALATLQVLEKEAGVQEQVVASAKQTLELTENQYLAGTVSYLNVVTAQTTLLAAQNAALDLQNRRLVAAITLIRASGGDLDNGSAAVTGVQSTPKSSAASGG
jgi:NodT family efflux transporter outer membrane factor (OMF) lipoprotein